MKATKKKTAFTVDMARLANLEAKDEQIRKAVGAKEGESTLAAVGRSMRATESERACREALQAGDDESTLAACTRVVGALNLRWTDLVKASVAAKASSTEGLIHRIHELNAKAAESDGSEILKIGPFTLRYRRPS